MGCHDMQHPALIAFLCTLTLFGMWLCRPIDRMSAIELRAQRACHALVAAALRFLLRILRS